MIRNTVDFSILKHRAISAGRTRCRSNSRIRGCLAMITPNRLGFRPLLFAGVEPYLAAIRAATSPRALAKAEWIVSSCGLGKAIRGDVPRAGEEETRRPVTPIHRPSRATASAP